MNSRAKKLRDIRNNGTALEAAKASKELDKLYETIFPSQYYFNQYFSQRFLPKLSLFQMNELFLSFRTLA